MWRFQGVDLLCIFKKQIKIYATDLKLVLDTTNRCFHLLKPINDFKCYFSKLAESRKMHYLHSSLLPNPNPPIFSVFAMWQTHSFAQQNNTMSCKSNLPATAGQAWSRVNETLEENTQQGFGLITRLTYRQVCWGSVPTRQRCLKEKSFALHVRHTGGGEQIALHPVQENFCEIHVRNVTLMQRAANSQHYCSCKI